MPPLHKAPKPQKKEFVPECKCGDPNCNVKDQSKKAADFLGIALNTASMMLCALKEAASAAPAPGLRQAAGGALVIVETIQAMGDSKFAFKHLLEDTMDMAFMVTTFVSEKAASEQGVSQALNTGVTKFGNNIAKIQKFVQKMQRRGFIMRVIFAKADKLKIDEYRTRLNQASTMFQVGMVMQILENTEGGAAAPEPQPLLSPEVLHKKALALAQNEIDKRDPNSVYNQSNNTIGPIAATVGNITVDNSPNARVKSYKSGNVKITNVQGSHNSHDVKTYYYGRPRY